MELSAITKLQKSLEQEAALLQEELRGLAIEPVKGDFHPVADNLGDSLEDAAQEAEQLDTNQAKVQVLKTRLAEIQDALLKIKNGEYGRCQTCSADIGEARLHAEPVAALCIDCAQKAQLG